MFEPKTAAMSNLCKAIGVERKALLVSDGVDDDLVRGTRNLPNVQAMPAQTLSSYLILTHDQLIMTEAAVRRCEAMWAVDGAEPSEGDGDA